MFLLGLPKILAFLIASQCNWLADRCESIDDSKLVLAFGGLSRQHSPKSIDLLKRNGRRWEWVAGKLTETRRPPCTSWTVHHPTSQVDGPREIVHSSDEALTTKESPVIPCSQETTNLLESRKCPPMIDEAGGNGEATLASKQMESLIHWLSLELEYLKYQALGEANDSDLIVSNFDILD